MRAMKGFQACLGTQKATFLAGTPCAEEKLVVSHGGECQNSAFERLRQKKDCHQTEASLNRKFLAFRGRRGGGKKGKGGVEKKAKQNSGDGTKYHFKLDLLLQRGNTDQSKH